MTGTSPWQPDPRVDQWISEQADILAELRAVMAEALEQAQRAARAYLEAHPEAWGVQVVLDGTALDGAKPLVYRRKDVGL